MTPVQVQTTIAAECDTLRDMLLSKNAAYGNSALDPLRVFSTAPASEQIKVRLDDKLSRIARGHAAGEDVEQDLIGYIILLRVYRTLTGEAVNLCTAVKILTEPAPIPMVLVCPDCHACHLDTGAWAIRPHCTHLCAHCGRTWKPANVPTVGVESLEFHV